ncbi:hypothetical protein EDC04DRAFT_482497 [Pisolithus marmoratus]|nr:hypothetical protein EDC04DRAFT_482497 [Pisolithus marmoratus]
MPYGQEGDSTTANIVTYNDVTGSQHNTSVSKPGQQIVDGPPPSKVENDVQGDQHNAHVSGNQDAYVSPRIVKKIIHEGKRILSGWTGNSNTISVHNDKSVHNNADTTNNNESHAVTNNTYQGLSVDDISRLWTWREPITSQSQLGSSNEGAGNTGPSHSGTAVWADDKSEQRTGTHANEDRSKLLAVSSPEGGQGARKPDAVPLCEQIKPSERPRTKIRLSTCQSKQLRLRTSKMYLASGTLQSPPGMVPKRYRFGVSRRLLLAILRRIMER